MSRQQRQPTPAQAEARRRQQWHHDAFAGTTPERRIALIRDNALMYPRADEHYAHAMLTRDFTADHHLTLQAIVPHHQWVRSASPAPSSASIRSFQTGSTLVGAPTPSTRGSILEASPTSSTRGSVGSVAEMGTTGWNPAPANRSVSPAANPNAAAGRSWLEDSTPSPPPEPLIARWLRRWNVAGAIERSNREILERAIEQGDGILEEHHPQNYITLVEGLVARMRSRVASR